MTGEIQFSDVANFVEKNSGNNSVSVDSNGVTADTVNTVREIINGGIELTEGHDFVNSPVKARANDDGYDGKGPFLLQGSRTESATGSSHTDKAYLRWVTIPENTTDPELLTQITAHQADNHFSIYTKDDAVGSGTVSTVKRLDIEGGSSAVPVHWQNVSEYWVGKYDSTPTDAYINSDGGNAETHIRSPDGSSRQLTFENIDTGAAGRVEFNNSDQIAFLVDDGSGFTPYTVIDPRGFVDLRGGELRGDGYQSRLNISDFANLPPRSSAPSSPQSGDIAVQDGANWDPAGTGNEEVVAYLNGGWVTLS